MFTGIGVALCLPQLSSVVAQSLPPHRLGVGGAANQAIRQFGGTLGVAVTIAVVGRPASLADALAAFDDVWLLLVAGGLATTALSLPLRTGARDAGPAPAPTPAAAGPVAGGTEAPLRPAAGR